MAKKVDISLRRLAKQERATETVRAIVEAAIYILKHSGARDFTTHKIAEKAGVNVASFYQYFPNKEALLFHITKINWERQLARLSPILTEKKGSPAQRFRDFMREFFLIEAEEADMRSALRIASVELKDTKEFKALLAKGADMTTQFIKGAIGMRKSDELKFAVEFIVHLTTSFAERTTDEGTSGAKLIKQADILTEMILGHFKIR